jgi:hypothetical protein
LPTLTKSVERELKRKKIEATVSTTMEQQQVPTTTTKSHDLEEGIFVLFLCHQMLNVL